MNHVYVVPEKKGVTCNKMAAVRGFLLTNISKVSIVFSSFDLSATSARDFFRIVSSTKMKESNPKCVVSVDIRGDYCKPRVDVTFKNGESLAIDPVGRKSLEIVAEVNTSEHTI